MITPPPELVQQWYDSIPDNARNWQQQLVAQAAQWGADQELEACCDTLQRHAHWDLAVFELMDDRRPKPPNLKEQALKMLRPLSNPVMPGTPEYRLYEPQAEIIRKALEALPND